MKIPYNNIVQRFVITFLLGDFLWIFGCKCPGPEHPQWLYCKSDFVIKAYVTNITNVYSEIIKTRPIGRNIHVHILQKYKGEKKFRKIDHTQIYSPLGCHITPRIRRKYIMMGLILDNKMAMTRCNYLQPTQKLSDIQRLGMKRLYRKNCRCKADIGTDSRFHISPSHPRFKGCTTRNQTTFGNGCYISHAICVRRSDGGCEWRGKFKKRSRRKKGKTKRSKQNGR